MELENYGFSAQDLGLAKSQIQSFKAKKGEVFYNDFCYGFVSVVSGELKSALKLAVSVVLRACQRSFLGS